MSGIAAIIRFDGSDPAEHEIAAMCAAMAWRGPDGSAQRRASGVAIGHCRFDTVAEGQGEVQPLADPADRWLLAMDGYLANREAICTALEQAGKDPPPAGTSDAALVLRAWQRWGADGAARLEGEFAILVWDRMARTAWCLRDHHGLRPLYWHLGRNQLLLASEIAAIIAMLPAPPELNRGYLAELAVDEAWSPEETVWRNIQRLLPAHVLRVSRGEAALRPYWQLPAEPLLRYRHEADHIAHYRSVLDDCVRAASRSHLPVACEVSGGLDSSGVFVVAHELFKSGRLPAPGLHGFTLAGPSGSDADELAFARAVAAHAGRELVERPLFLPQLDWFSARAAQEADLPPLPNAAMSIGLDEAAAAAGCRVSLNGIGGDQWLDGTQYYYWEQFRAADLRGLWRSLRADAGAFGPVAALGMFVRLGPGGLVPEWLRAAWRKNGGAGDIPAWLPDDMQQELAWRRQRYRATLPAGNRASYKLRKLQHPRWSLILDSAGRQRARSGLEMRSPLLSRRFIEFSVSTPEHLRLQGGVTKLIHRRALAGSLPPLVLDRQTKAEFSTTYFNLEAALRDYCQSAPPPGADGQAMAELFDRYFATPIDDRPTGAIWGAYVCALMAQMAGAFRSGEMA